MIRQLIVTAGRAAAAALLALLWTADASDAQSLAGIAQREQARRAAVAEGRVYTDADLRPVAAPRQAPPAVPTAPAREAPPAAGPSGGGAPSARPESEPATPPAQPGAPGTVIEGREKRDEEYWRNRARDVRGRLARAVADVEAAERRLAEIDAGGRVSAAHERQVVADALEQLRTTVGFLREEVAVFETRARIENVPEEWTR